MSSPPPPPGTAVLRGAVVVVLVLTVVAAALLVLRGLDEMNRSDLSGRVPPLFAPAVLTVLGGVASAAVVEGLARVAGRPAAAADPGLAGAVEQLRAAAVSMASPPAPPPAVAQPSAAEPEAAEPAFESVVADEPAVADPAVDPYLPQFERMVQLLDEIRELTVLDEAGRAARGQAAKDRRKAGRLDEADLLAHRHEWAQADALLTLLESLHPGDAEVLARRTEVDDARSAHREAEWAQLVRHAEDLMALSRYDEAAAAVAAFRASYPNHDDAAGLAAQVAGDRDAHVEAGVNALFHEIKTAVDGRQWRMALDGCQRFLHRFADHPRADRIRQQLRPIQKNAEVEERHEQEERIKDMARAGRFAEAADLCQDLLDRFPDAPQAPSLRNLLPRLRERSALAEAAVE